MENLINHKNLMTEFVNSFVYAGGFHRRYDITYDDWRYLYVFALKKCHEVILQKHIDWFYFIKNELLEEKENSILYNLVKNDNGISNKKQFLDLYNIPSNKTFILDLVIENYPKEDMTDTLIEFCQKDRCKVRDISFWLFEILFNYLNPKGIILVENYITLLSEDVDYLNSTTMIYIKLYLARIDRQICAAFLNRDLTQYPEELINWFNEVKQEFGN